MASNRELSADLTVTGHDQANLNRWMANMTDLMVEMQTDHATTKTAVDGLNTLTDELRADHATFLTLTSANKVLLNNVRTHLTGDRIFSGDPALVIDTDFDVKTGAAAIQISVDGAIGTVAAAKNVDTGTSATFPTTKWGIMNISSTVAGATSATWATATGSGYDNEAAAITALPASPSGEACIGYVTVQAHSTGTFLSGTDALTTGSGGDVANATNYTTIVDPLGVVTAAVSAGDVSSIGAAEATAGPASLTNSGVPTLKKA